MISSIQQARWFTQASGASRGMYRKRHQELLSNLRWLNATKRTALYPNPQETNTQKTIDQILNSHDVKFESRKKAIPSMNYAHST